MENNIIALNSARPEFWKIIVDGRFEVSSFGSSYSKEHQTWIGVINARSIDELPGLLPRARSSMRTAKLQNKTELIAVRA